MPGMHALPQTSNALTAAQIGQYRRDGFVVVPRLFNAADLAQVEATIARIAAAIPAGSSGGEVLEFEPALVDGKRSVRRIHDPCERDHVFRDLSGDPRLLDRVEALIGPDLGLQHSKLNMKPAHVGSAVEWHQDLAYFPHTNDDLVTALVYLDDADEENGCLQVLPGHHHGYFRHARPDGIFAGMITESFPGIHGTPRPLPAPAGSVILMHAILPHASLPNRSPNARKTLIFEYRAADSFPIHYGPHVAKTEALARHLRGKRSLTARFGGPPPLIPHLAAPMASLYEMQLRAKHAGAQMA